MPQVNGRGEAFARDFKAAPHGYERRSAGEFIPRHRHRHPYASVILSGGYEETGDHGRHLVIAGDVVLHRPFEAHLDRFTTRGAEIFGFALPTTFHSATAVVTVEDPQRLMRLAAQGETGEALALLAAAAAPGKPMADWPDVLAEALTRDPKLSLGGWADAHALAPATVSRGFRQVYGISPNAFRAQARARLAWHMLQVEGAALAGIAAEAGFADQSHMTRAVFAVTGRTPGAWRSQVK